MHQPITILHRAIQIHLFTKQLDNKKTKKFQNSMEQQLQQFHNSIEQHNSQKLLPVSSSEKISSPVIG